MTRVLALSNMYPPHSYGGGYELSCRDVMERFRERGHDTAVLTTTMRVPGVRDDPDEIANGVWRDLRFAWDDHVLLSPNVARRLIDERHNQRCLARALDRFEPEVVSVWNMGAMSLGLLTTLARRRIPVVLNICDEWPEYGPRLDPWARLFADRPPIVGRIANLVTRVPAGLPDLSAFCAVYVSAFTRDKNLKYSRMHPDFGAVVWSGIDERDFPLAPEAQGRDRPWRWRLLGVGRIDDRKGIEVAVRALALLPEEATLRWIGRGEEHEKARLTALAADLGVANRLSWDEMPRDQLRAAYAEADVFVFPSVWDEPFGLVPIEAMANNVPVVGSGTGGSSEFMLDGATAVLAAAGDPSALANAVRRLAADDALRARVVAGGRVVASELTIEHLVDNLEQWHTRAATGFAAGRPAPRALQLN